MYKPTQKNSEASGDAAAVMLVITFLFVYLMWGVCVCMGSQKSTRSTRTNAHPCQPHALVCTCRHELDTSLLIAPFRAQEVIMSRGTLKNRDVVNVGGVTY